MGSPPSRRECKARTGHSRAASCSPVYARRFGAGVQRQRTVLTLNIPFAGNVVSISPLSSRFGVEVKKAAPDSAGFSPTHTRFLMFTWRLSARLPVRREDYSTDLRQTGQCLEPGCSERRGRDGWLRRFCRATPPWCGLPVRREDYSTDLRQTGQRLEPGCSERRGRKGWLRRFCRTTPPWPD
jgi:hypothetical protein